MAIKKQLPKNPRNMGVELDSAPTHSVYYESDSGNEVKVELHCDGAYNLYKERYVFYLWLKPKDEVYSKLVKQVATIDEAYQCLKELLTTSSTL
jgi:hypothetical protein